MIDTDSNLPRLLLALATPAVCAWSLAAAGCAATGGATGLAFRGGYLVRYIAP